LEQQALEKAKRTEVKMHKHEQAKKAAEQNLLTPTATQAVSRQQRLLPDHAVGFNPTHLIQNMD